MIYFGNVLLDSSLREINIYIFLYLTQTNYLGTLNVASLNFTSTVLSVRRICRNQWTRGPSQAAATTKGNQLIR